MIPTVSTVKCSIGRYNDLMTEHIVLETGPAGRSLLCADIIYLPNNIQIYVNL